MFATKKRTLIGFTLGVWVVGMVSATALAYDLNRPLDWTDTARGRSAPIDPPRLSPVEALSEPQTVLRVPTVTIVAPMRSGPVAEAKPEVPEIHPLRCADWRELDMGSGRVQICE